MNSGRLLLLTTDDGQRPGGGREQLSRLLHDVLAELSSAVETVRLTGRTGPIGALRGRLNGLTGGIEANIGRALLDPGLSRVIIDGSNLGAAAGIVKRVRPDLPVTTFFHNCETRFFADALRAAPTLRALAVLVGHWRAERLAVRRSDCRIALSQRDSDELARRFGRGADAILPMALADRREPAALPVRRDEPYVLFVGGGFFGNVDGLRWYARAIVPRLAPGIRTVVVGRGLDALAGTLPGTMELVGPVDDLSPWYAGAALVVAPILTGSGMKTKVAEALMHGKRVIGTAEAFSGYGDDVLAANRQCDDAGQFAEEVSQALAFPPPAFDPAQRALYERFHARAAMVERLRAIFAA